MKAQMKAQFITAAEVAEIMGGQPHQSLSDCSGHEQ